MHEAGILERSRSFYWALIAFTFVGYGLSIAGVVVFESYLALTAACLGVTFFTTQMAGLMHDGGHRAAFSSIWANNLMGYAGSAAIGMVFPNWMSRHNQHHAFSNQEGKDPDLEVPFIAVSPEAYRSKDRLQRAAAKWQVYYYYPLGSIVGFSNRLGSIMYFLRNRSRVNFWRFLLYLPAIVVLYVGPFLLFPLDKALFVFLLTHISTGIYLANCFAPNHKGMQVIPRGVHLSFLEQQVVTSRSVRGGFFTDLMLVGLNHQVEHHLFPSCPRNKLPLLTPYVRQACEAEGIPFLEESFIEANRSILRQLRLASASNK